MGLSAGPLTDTSESFCFFLRRVLEYLRSHDECPKADPEAQPLLHRVHAGRPGGARSGMELHGSGHAPARGGAPPAAPGVLRRGGGRVRARDAVRPRTLRRVCGAHRGADLVGGGRSRRPGRERRPGAIRPELPARRGARARLSTPAGPAERSHVYGYRHPERAGERVRLGDRGRGPRGAARRAEVRHGLFRARAPRPRRGITRPFASRSPSSNGGNSNTRAVPSTRSSRSNRTSRSPGYCSGTRSNSWATSATGASATDARPSSFRSSSPCAAPWAGNRAWRISGADCGNRPGSSCGGDRDARANKFCPCHPSTRACWVAWVSAAYPCP